MLTKIIGLFTGFKDGLYFRPTADWVITYLKYFRFVSQRKA